MIVLINGPFGVGKTSVSRLLAPRLGAGVFDPERIGWVLRRVVPTDDYQDLAAWRKLAVVGARLVRLRHQTVLVPMTLWRHEYFDEIAQGLRTFDPDLRAFRLVADRRVLRTRILSSEEAREWRLDHVESGLRAFSDPHFGQVISADGAVEEVVDELETRLR